MTKLLNYQLVRYGLVGGVNVIFDYLILNFCYLFLHINLTLSVLAGFLVANSVSYILHSRWTFRYNTKGKEALKLGQFFLIGLISLGITESTIYTLSNFFHLYYNFSKAVAVVISAAWAYSSTRWWVFR